MATTPGGLPYPVGTDFVVNGDDAIHALALGVDTKVSGDIQRGTIAVAASGVTQVNFPRAFSAVPHITANASDTANIVVVHITGVTAAGFGVRLYTLGSAQVAGNVNWHAIGAH